MPPRKRSSKQSRAAQHRALLNKARPRYEEMLASQAGGCAICGRGPKNRRLDIDHDHKAMYVRGLLCVPCNRGIHSWMTAEWLRKAAEYLEKGDPGWV